MTYELTNPEDKKIYLKKMRVLRDQIKNNPLLNKK